MIVFLKKWYYDLDINWYKKGGMIMLSHYNFLLSKALADVFPNIGLKHPKKALRSSTVWDSGIISIIVSFLKSNKTINYS